ncbi:MAG TPA: DoxX family protein [Gemmatimonadaceae bacterium]
MPQTASKKINATLWTLQIIVGALFIFAGGFKLIVPFATLAKQMPVALPAAFIHTIAVLELLGGLGMILPGLFRLPNILTPLAAGGLIVIMSGAIGITIATGPFQMAAMPFMTGLLAASVAYGRTFVAPAQRTARRSNVSATQPTRLARSAA